MENRYDDPLTLTLEIREQIMDDRLAALRATLKKHDQSHLLSFWEELSSPHKELLLTDLESINFGRIDSLIASHVRQPPETHLPPDLAPASYYPLSPTAEWNPENFRQQGELLIRGGKVAAFTVAGGQGTRLGWNGPKGTFPAGVVSGKPLFRLFAEQILATERKYGTTIPWYIMTSPLNDADTRSFFLDNNCFGLPRTNIFAFPQGMMPSLEPGTGKILLAEKHRVALNPDGHGGSLRALSESGALEDMTRRGIEHISYFQIDNPLVRAIDPLFLGLHASADDSSGEISSKMVAKANAAERVGVFCQSEGKTMVVEYSDLPDDLAQETNEDGSLKFNAGSIAVHILGVSFVEKIAVGGAGFKLPFHRADKKVEHIDLKSGEMRKPDQPNAVKLETFIFDAIPLAESSIVLETDRGEEFGPIKNAKGSDSKESSHQLQTERAARWLETRGITIPRSESGGCTARIEISPLTALEPEDLNESDLPEAIADGEDLLL